MKTISTLLALAATTTLAFSQGDLAPTAAPAPTMKTLAQIEARTPIPASPALPIAGPHFTITQPGSYYLTGNVTVTTGDAIVITAASDVSLDLNGFTIRSTLTVGANGRGISMPGDFARLTVCNGSIVSGSIIPTSGTRTLQGFNNAIFSSLTLREAFISGVRIRGMAGTGMLLDQASIVENCTASDNGDIGIGASHGSTVTSCTANNNGNIGITADQGIVTNSTASRNFKNGILVGFGIAAQCFAEGNSTDPASVDKQISVAFGGQRVNCVPATE